MELNVGKISPGVYNTMSLLINGDDIVTGDSIEVEADDSTSALRDAINAIDGVSCEMNEDNELVISHDTSLTITGERPDGYTGVCESLWAGTYE
jgi:hypothetical protein